MTWEATVACIVAMAIPGPAVFALISRTLVLGFRRSLPFVAGMVLGDVALVIAAISGLAALAAAMGEFFAVLKYFAAAYLFYLGYKVFTSPAQTLKNTAVAKDNRARAVTSGWLVTFGNPKGIIFYMALFPAFVNIPSLNPLDFAGVCATVFLCVSGVMVGYAFFCANVRRLFKSPSAVRVLNRIAGATMVGAAVAVTSR